MRVKVQPINILGRPQNTSDRKLGEVHVGDLKVVEKRVDAFGRALTVAEVVDPTRNAQSPILQLFDADLLWISANQLRMRGFEICGGTQFAQSWDIEVLAVAANAKS